MRDTCSPVIEWLDRDLQRAGGRDHRSFLRNWVRNSRPWARLLGDRGASKIFYPGGAWFMSKNFRKNFALPVPNILPEKIFEMVF
jgi:hypothetical protein